MSEAKCALIVATVASTIDQFCMNDIEILTKMDYEIDIAANFRAMNNTSIQRVEEFRNELLAKGYNIHDICFSRSPFSFSNFRAFLELKKLSSSKTYNLIHCHTPVASMITRFVVRKSRKMGTNIFYTAHGFHFFNGAPKKNWLIYYPIEYFLSRYTDVLITINKEDFNRAKKFKAHKVKYIPGVGIDTKKFSEILINKVKKRKELGIPENAFVVLSVGELNKNKNHEIIIKAIAGLNNPDIFYVICGKGSLKNYLRKLVQKLNLEKQIKFLEFRKDVDEICKVADVFAFPSKREGLGLAAIEAMASGLPIVTSNIHGIMDYSIDGVTGYTCSPTDVDAFSRAINKLIYDDTLKIKIGEKNKRSIEEYDIKFVQSKMKEIYGEI